MKKSLRISLRLMFSMLLSYGLHLSAQDLRVITGKITDAANKEVVTGATIAVPKSTIATVSDTAGNYSIAVPQGTQELQVSFIGYKKKSIKIGATDELNIAIDEDINAFDDVVVTANAVKREKRSLGYATSTVKEEDLTAASDRSALNALQGKVAGVNITQSSGDPGASTRIVLRGGGSILGNNQALIVVDGVPQDNSNFGVANDLNGQSDVLNSRVDAGNRANDLNPNDIENITVLKGPAAAALYGSRASNGALIITTKSGRKNAGNAKTWKVSLNSSTSFSNILRLPQFQNTYGQGGEKLPDSRENFSWGPKMDGVLRPWGQAIDGEQRIKPYAALPNNVASFFNTGITTNNNVSLEGAFGKTFVYLSYNNINTTGVIPTAAYQRHSVKLNLTHDFSDKLTLAATVNYIKTKGDLILQGQSDQSVYNNILQTPRDIPVQELKDLDNKFNTLEGFYGAYTVNPYYSLRNNKVKNDVDRFVNTFTLTYKPLKWLDVIARVGTDNYTDGRITSQRKYNTTNQGGDRKFDGSYSEDIYRVLELNSDIMVSAHHTFKNDITLSGMIGNNIRQNRIKNTYASTAGLAIDDYFNLQNSLGRPVTSNLLSMRRLVGLYATADFGYKNFFFLGVTARNDWSSTLPKGKNSYFYPSVNTSLVITELTKINPMILSYAKVRASLAQVGSDASPYLLTNVFVSPTISDGYAQSNFTPPFPSGDGKVPGYSVSNQLGNQNIKPEITTSWEVGAEVSFLKDRLSVDFTYYQNFTRNQIIPIDVAPSSGFTSQIINAGKVTNKGVELAVRVTPLNTKWGLKWEVYGTFTKNINRVAELLPGTDQVALGGFSTLSIVAQKGLPYGAFFGVTAERDPNGNVIIDTTNGAPVLSSKPKVLGTFQPDWLGSLGTTVSYKGIRFSILFDHKQGGMIYSRTKNVQEFVGTSPNTLYNDREAFIVPGSVYAVGQPDGSVQYIENTTHKVDAQRYWTDYNNADNGAALLSSTFTKLREVSLGYTFPAKLMKKTKFFQNVELALYGSNLALWTPKSNTYIDPETSSYASGNVQGFEYGTTPSTKTYGFRVKLDF